MKTDQKINIMTDQKQHYRLLNEGEEIREGDEYFETAWNIMKWRPCSGTFKHALVPGDGRMVRRPIESFVEENLDQKAFNSWVVTVSPKDAVELADVTRKAWHSALAWERSKK